MCLIGARGMQALQALIGRLLQELREAQGDAEEATQLLMSQQCVLNLTQSFYAQHGLCRFSCAAPSCVLQWRLASALYISMLGSP